MSQSETRKYQLFPREKQAAGPQGKGLDPEQAFALAMAQNGDKADKPCAGGLRLRIKEHNLIRRRKVSVPELGPMTTVHEAAMDSPTIPGRPACHERSISAPGNGWKVHHLAYRNETHLSPLGDSASDISTIAIPQPQSPKNLPPLVIPVQTSSLPRLTRQLSLNRLRSGSTGSAESGIRPARTDESPRTRSPYTPHSASLTANTPMSSAPSSTFSNSSLPTPVSGTTEPRASPKPWKGEANPAGLETPKDQGTEFVQSMATPRSAVEPRSASSFSHRRNVSESASIATSIMDRGRPRKRSDGIKRSASKASKSAERRAFETLPKGWKVTDAAQMLEQAERVALHKQAMQQAARFEVMRKEDVDSLSRELRNLDERTEYLRRTYHSLRAGRRNLHSRICQYLRSPRMAKFSHDSMLKQEEALAELDSSIDDWVNKLEQAENRRTRIRQKLLEHVAAAVTLPVSGAVVVSESLQLALGVGAAPPTAPANLSTPPRSPVKSSFTPRIESSSPSPQRVVAQVPSTIIEQPVVENAVPVGLGINQTGEKQTQVKKDNTQHPISGIRRADVESIRIYAGDEVAALLADVESQMDRMSRAADDAAALRAKDTCVPELPELNSNMSEEERKQIHRQHSHEKLQGTPTTSSSSSTLDTITGTTTSKSSSPNSTPRTATPTVTETKEPPAGELFLTNAVFKP
ncbi:Up-regulated during septation-domain-containing protein [Diaporthe sp. PMI_573]|nr:Up-regulated during septation-domain-containing protein [Diaporthaceae sp. PMI_573]